MASRPFEHPYSMPRLLACKAAERQGGPEAHRATFDRAQRAHLTECLNIADFEVLRQCSQEIGLGVARWEREYHAPATREAVEEDLARARQYGITGVPTLVADQKYALTGAQGYEHLKTWLQRVLERRASRP